MLKMARNGQVTIPKDIRDKLRLVEGDYFQSEMTEEGDIILRPVKVTRKRITMTEISERVEKALTHDNTVGILESEAEIKAFVDGL